MASERKRNFPKFFAMKFEVEIMDLILQYGWFAVCLEKLRLCRRNPIRIIIIYHIV